MLVPERGFMFRTMSGFRAPYHYLTLIVIAEFNEWRVMLLGDGVTIQGRRQFNESSAKQHALDVARQFVHERRQEDLPILQDVEWRPTATDDWLVWST
jgi:hypothetical protein